MSKWKWSAYDDGKLHGPEVEADDAKEAAELAAASLADWWDFEWPRYVQVSDGTTIARIRVDVEMNPDFVAIDGGSE